MITSEATSASTSPQDLAAERTRDLSVLFDLLAAEPASMCSGALLALASEAWQAGYAAAREHPVCDWCSEAVVPRTAFEVGMTRPSWAHQATGRYGCEHRPDCYAQVRGCGTPAGTAEFDARAQS